MAEAKIEMEQEHDEGVPMMQGSTSSISFRITQKDARPLPTTKDLPESIYGAAMMAVMRSSQTLRSKTVHGVSICVFAGLVLNIFTQFYAFHRDVFFEGQFSGDAWQHFPHAGELCQVPLSQPMFFFAILVMWTATCWVDLAESYRYMRLWCNLNQPESNKFVEIEHRDDVILTTAAAQRTKAVVVCLILVPKIAIALVLWWLGARWLTSTTNFQDLLLNAAALAFITGLDELMYQVIVPEDIQALVGTYKIVRQGYSLQASVMAENSNKYCHAVREEVERASRRRIARIVVTMLAITAIPILYMRYLQDVLPDYRWDVHEPCESRAEELMDAEFLG